jgi:hypothetical protein
MIRRFLDRIATLATAAIVGAQPLRRLWPFVMRRTYERDVAGLQERLEQERRRVEALVWWRGGGKS